MIRLHETTIAMQCYCIPIAIVLYPLLYKESQALLRHSWHTISEFCSCPQATSSRVITHMSVHTSYSEICWTIYAQLKATKVTVMPFHPSHLTSHVVAHSTFKSPPQSSPSRPQSSQCCLCKQKRHVLCLREWVRAVKLCCSVLPAACRNDCV